MQIKASLWLALQKRSIPALALGLIPALFSEDNKLSVRHTVSGPAVCAWTRTYSPFPVRHASSSNPNSLTLVGYKQSEGILLLDNKPICDDGWNIQAAHVACKQLRFSRALQATTRNLAHVDAFSLDQVQCTGLETDLRNCSHKVSENCDAGEAAGVVCDTRTSREIQAVVESKTEECFALNVLYGSLLTAERSVLPTLLDCQELCARTKDCNIFSYDTTTKECSLHMVDNFKPLADSVTREIGGIQIKTYHTVRALCNEGRCSVRLRIFSADITDSCETKEFSELIGNRVATLNITSMGTCHVKSLIGTEFTMLVTQTGFDGWIGEWINITFTDGSSVHCSLGNQFLVHGSTATISCFEPSETGEEIILYI